jgi:hypothetical protein
MISPGNFYRKVIQHLVEAELPFVVGGAYGLRHYTGIVRDTKDVDLFVRPADCTRVLALLEEVGYTTELTSDVWLGKAFHGDDFADIIFSSGNGIAEVDDAWLDRAPMGEVLDLVVPICPPEEMIWSKGYVVERERYDGADVAHLVRACGRAMDWTHLMTRFADHWRVLLSHLVLFGFVYPGEQDVVPGWVMRALTTRLHDEVDAPPLDERWCRGTLLSRHQYRVDVEAWGYRDGRLAPHGRLTADQVATMDRESACASGRGPAAQEIVVIGPGEEGEESPLEAPGGNHAPQRQGTGENRGDLGEQKAVDHDDGERGDEASLERPPVRPEE